MISCEQQPPRKREFLFMGIAVLLGYAYLSDMDWRDQKAIEEAKERIELSLQACQRAIDTADRHTRILTHILDKGGAITINGEVQAVCRTWKAT